MSTSKRITEEIKLEMVQLHIDGLNFREIGDKFGCSREYVRQVMNQLGQKNLTPFRVKEKRKVRKLEIEKRKKERIAKLRHGTRHMYIYYKCRCLPCKQANNLYMKSLRNREGDPPSHGLSGYVNYNCRCDICKKAQSDRLWLTRKVKING